jgi:hypothetical protein
MAKPREMRTIDLDSIEVELPLTIRHGEHRRIERLTIQMAAEDFNTIKETFGTSLDELESRATDPANMAQAADQMTDHEVTATLMVLCDLSQDDIDDIDRDDFVELQDVLQSMYRKTTTEERDQGKALSGNNIKVAT